MKRTLTLLLSSTTVLFMIMFCSPQAWSQTNDTTGASAAPQEQNQPKPPDGAPLPSKDPDAPGQPNKPSLLTPLAPQTERETYIPITARQRMRWFITETIWPQHLVGGVITSGFGTAVDRPKEYGTHWDGFAERFGMRLTGVTTSNAMEVAIGAAWGEDPRYFRVPGQPFGARLKSVVRQTFEGRQRDGEFAPAYGRYAAVAGSNFLSNTWRADSEANTHDALIRTAEGFAGRMAANAFEEFWPDLKNKVFHHAQ